MNRRSRGILQSLYEYIRHLPSSILTFLSVGESLEMIISLLQSAKPKVVPPNLTDTHWNTIANMMQGISDDLLLDGKR